MDQFTGIMFAIIALLALVLGIYAARKAYQKWASDDAEPPAGFTLGTLRELRRRGQLTEAEFERAREKIIVGATRTTETVEPNANFTAKGVDFTGGFPVGSPPRKPPEPDK